MSLTRQVKHELARLKDTFACCNSWELKALLVKNGYYMIRQNKHNLVVVVDANAVARRVFNLFRYAGINEPYIVRQQENRLRKSRFLVQVSGQEQIDSLLVYLGFKEAGNYLSLPRKHMAVPKRNCCRKALLRGIFLAGGSVSATQQSGYHLEINCGSIEDAFVYKEILQDFNLKPFIRERSEDAFIYFKSAEAIADYLRIIGAGSTLLELESNRVVKSMRNQVNRVVNCETANLEKIVSSAQAQLALIDRIDRCIGLNNLSPSLREAARLRRSYPEASLQELGKKLDPPVSKSGISHRFRQMEKLANKPGISKNKQRTCQSED
ncbi:MAG: DNA-binding protein WhiA [Bacillota bacterium]